VTSTFVSSTRVDPATGKAQWQARFVSLPHALLSHPSFQDLSGGAFKVLVTLLGDYVGNNNGHLTATFSRMKCRGFHSKDSLSKSLRELTRLGYILKTRAQRLRSPALYAISWLPINRPPVGVTYDTGIASTDEAPDLWRHSTI
jgi:hypothetical protein